MALQARAATVHFSSNFSSGSGGFYSGGGVINSLRLSLVPVLGGAAWRLAQRRDGSASFTAQLCCIGAKYPFSK